MTVRLSVNLNAIAFLRNRRSLPWPNVVDLGRKALCAGAHGLTVHPRPDQRHIRYRDVADIKALIDKEFPHCEFNIEGFPTPDFLDCIEENNPTQVTLVPDSPDQSTSDHGWDFSSWGDRLSLLVGHFKKRGLRVSLFVEPVVLDMKLAFQTRTDRVELYTGPYGACFDNPEAEQSHLEKLYEAASFAHRLGLQVNAGHDLTLDNLPSLITKIPFLSEVSIGHALIGKALETGIAQATQEFLSICQSRPIL